MKIKLFGNLRQKAGQVEWAASGNTLREALDNLCADNEPLRAAIYADDALQPHVRVMINGRDSELDQGFRNKRVRRRSDRHLPAHCGWLESV